MTIQYIPLSDSEYSNRRFDVILKVEGKDYYPYLDTQGYPTIGIGFKIQDNWEAILDGMGFDMSEDAPAAEKSYIAQIEAVINSYGSTLTSAQFNQYKDDLDAIMANRAAAYGISRTEFKYLTDDEVRQTFDLIIEADYEDRLSKWLGETTMYTVVPKSFARIALLSLTYNGYIGYDYQNNRPIGSPSLRKALLVDGNRAEAWYEIRYNTPSSAERLAKSKIAYSTNPDIFKDTFNKIKRNFFEAELLGLYNNPASVNADEAKQVYRMFQNHREDIAKQEALFGVSFDGKVGSYILPTSGKTPLQAANSDYNAATIFKEIDNIEISLNPAKDALFEWLNERTDLPDLKNYLTANNIASSNIYLAADPNQSSTLDSLAIEQRYIKNGANDLMIGGDQADTMYGRKGNDVLIGESGDDKLFGNEGNDVIYGGTGIDILDGGADVDTMLGGADDDTYKVDNSDDKIVEKGGEGKDLVQSTADNYTLPNYVEDLTLMGTDNINGTGNELDNVIKGNTGNNKLEGGLGIARNLESMTADGEDFETLRRAA